MEENQQPKKLTKKQEIFVETFTKTNDRVLAATIAFDTNGKVSARTIADKLLQNGPVVQAIESKRKTLKQALIDNGVTEDKIAKKVDALLDATDDDGRPDYVAIDKGIKHAATFHGVTDLEDPRGAPKNVYNIIFSASVQERVREIEGEIRDMLTKKKPDA